MQAEVHALGLFIFIYAHTNREIDGLRDDKRRDAGERKHDDGGQRLLAKQVEPATGEETITSERVHALRREHADEEREADRIDDERDAAARDRRRDALTIAVRLAREPGVEARPLPGAPAAPAGARWPRPDRRDGPIR